MLHIYTRTRSYVLGYTDLPDLSHVSISEVGEVEVEGRDGDQWNQRSLLSFLSQWQVWPLCICFFIFSWTPSVDCCFPRCFFPLQKKCLSSRLCHLKCQHHTRWFPRAVLSLVVGSLQFIAVTTGVCNNFQPGFFVSLINMQLSPLSRSLTDITQNQTW